MGQVRDRLETVLTRAIDPADPGALAYLSLSHDTARAEADAADARARAGLSLGPLDGALVSIKDILDAKGETTTVGSAWYRVKASADAPVVARLRAAGAVIVGRTNLSEFAFHGIGSNPHFGTPKNPIDPARVPGGSSAGAAVSVATGLADIGIGTDTAGSVRIPAAWCGLVGFKPTQSRVPRQGCFPLSQTLDSIGPLTHSTAMARATDAVLAGLEPPGAAAPRTLPGLRLGLPTSYALDQLDQAVNTAFHGALDSLGRAGALISPLDIAPVSLLAEVNAKGGFSPVEAFAIHRATVDGPEREKYDPFVLSRIERGRGVLAADYLDMLARRAEAIAAMDARLATVDALVMPTVATLPPRFDAIATPETFLAANMLALRNTVLANFFDLCAITLPIPAQTLPIGLMLVGRRGSDQALFCVAEAVEAHLLRAAS